MAVRLGRLRRFGPRRLHTGSRRTLGGGAADDGAPQLVDTTASGER
ncbi:hypothetical protein OHA37_38365 [Streptomyces sp. NBC_00335]|nr:MULTISPECIES: hypothetical protein [unclassified Streptomyces]MCX5409710.1 hypothetical protein [Streptomyces sp. NBC_00086]